MRWTPGGISSDVEDRRGASGGFGGFGRGPTIGCGGAIILLVLSLLTGKNFFAMFDGSGGGGPVQQAPAGQPQSVPPTSQTPEEQKRYDFIAKFLVDDIQSTWTQVFQQEGLDYQHSGVVIYRDITPTACGTGQAASGPFYCPSDGKVYLDLGFFDELDRRFGAPGDFAQAYVVAHEMGHHVQNLVGTSDKVHEAIQSDRRNANEYSVRLELQADCYAGIWAASAAQRGKLEAGDVEEGLAAASAVGDDRIQEMSGRAVNPDGFTHGSAAQRMEWFQRGYKSGRIRDCDTFR
ncbi:MAG TPA: neutral zinc metallopeptidase [Thermoanaerobaculia bacterium]|nr:neutral zinc metallopeptidase [Thermoanaerobaculia bacterium]